MNERRRERLASFLASELPRFFREEIELPADTLISIVHIDIKESGQGGMVFVSIFPDASRGQVAEILKKSENRATHFVRARLRTKFSPTIVFRIAERGLVAKW